MRELVMHSMHCFCTPVQDVQHLGSKVVHHGNNIMIFTAGSSGGENFSFKHDKNNE